MNTSYSLAASEAGELLSMRFRISSTRQTVMRGPSFTGLGKRPDLTPAHQVLFDTGMMAGMGGLLFGSPI
jgi:hypothetical protein